MKTLQQQESEPLPGNSTPANAPESAAADLSLFLQASFDASTYVSSLLAEVDTTFTSSSKTTAEPPTPTCSGRHLQVIPTSPTATRTSSISLSPLTPTYTRNPQDAQDPSARKREQAQEDLDLALAISRLNLAIEELDRSISTQVAAHAPQLLKRTSKLSLMQAGVAETREGIQSLEEEVARLRAKVHDPFSRLVELQGEFKVMDSASELVARTRSVVALARRLESQMEVVFARKDVSSKKDREAETEGEDAVVGLVHGKDLSRAALLVAEITTLLDAERQQDGSKASLHDVKLIQDLIPTVESARKTIVDYMEDMIVSGLRDLSPLMLSSSLQTAFNLGMLPTLVQDLLNDLTEVVKQRTAAAFDLDSISRQLNLPLPTLDAPTMPSYSAYRGGRRATNNTNEEELRQLHRQTQQTWCDAIWTKLESLIVTEMGAVCSKVYLLEKVLKLKSDTESGTNLLTAALEVLGDRPTYTFWLTFAQSLQEQLQLASGKSTWLTHTLSSGVSSGGGDGYPKLLRMFHEFFAKISVYTDVQYTAAHQSAETVIAIKSLGRLEAGYVDKCTARVGEILSEVSTPASGGGGRRVVVGEQEAEGVVRLMANALDTTRFDPLLSRAVLVRCTGLVDQFVSQIGAVVDDDEDAWTLSPDAGRATQAQVWNAGLVRFAYALSQGLAGVAADQQGSSQPTITISTPTSSYAATELNRCAQAIAASTRTSLLGPLLGRVRSSISTTMSKMHVQLASTRTSSAPSRGKARRGVSIDSTTGASAYALGICEMLSYLRTRLLPLYAIEVRAAVANVITRWVVEQFCLHAAIFPFSKDDEADTIKLHMATDMTELELGLSQLVETRASSATAWVQDEQEAMLAIGTDAMKCMKAFRRFLFLSLDEIEQEAKANRLDAIPTPIVVLYLLSRDSSASAEVVDTLASTQDATKLKDFATWMLESAHLQNQPKSILAQIQAVAVQHMRCEQASRIITSLSGALPESQT